jgi:hypothetical protein
MLELTAMDAYTGAGGRWASQTAIDSAIQAMESTGIGIDVAFFTETVKKARHDETEALAVLAELLKKTGFTPLFKDSKKGPSDVWRSISQQKKLLHGFLRLPLSPLWKLGAVKPGETKLDETALRWIVKQPAARAHSALLNKMLDLRRIRSSLKYLEKMPNYVASDGLIHPICGPAGDYDDRVGAVTGRLAMKKPEGQQLPRDKHKDPYRVRRGFVCGPTPWGRGWRLSLQVHDELVLRGHGRLIVADFNALEIRILAHITKVLFGDSQLADDCSPGAPDLHTSNAKKIFGKLLGWKTKEGHPVGDLPDYAFKCEDPKLEVQYCVYLRELVKAVWYGLQYGKGAYGFGSSLLDDAGAPIGETRAGEIVNGLLTARPGIRKYQNWVREFISEYEGIPSLDGRWCDLRDLVNGDKWAFERAWRRALNFPMQSGGAAIIGASMVAVTNDPCITNEEDPERVSARLVQLMETSFPLCVPLTVSAHLGVNYDECK